MSTETQVRELDSSDQIITDLHLEHPNIVSHGYRPEGFENIVAQDWDSKVVTSTQRVYHLGDINMKRLSVAHDWIKARPGWKGLTVGNHDTKPFTWYLSNGWNEVAERIYLTYPEPLSRHVLYNHLCPLRILGDWDHIPNDVIERPRILLSHIPQPDDGMFDLNIHGHFHCEGHRANKLAMVKIRNAKQRLLALELVGYKLVNLMDFIVGKVQQDRTLYEYEATGVTCNQCKTSELLWWTGGDQAVYCRTCDPELVFEKSFQNPLTFGM